MTATSADGEDRREVGWGHRPKPPLIMMAKTIADAMASTAPSKPSDVPHLAPLHDCPRRPVCDQQRNFT